LAILLDMLPPARHARISLVWTVSLLLGICSGPACLALFTGPGELNSAAWVALAPARKHLTVAAVQCDAPLDDVPPAALAVSGGLGRDAEISPTFSTHVGLQRFWE
jgi:hypothetical protein